MGVFLSENIQYMEETNWSVVDEDCEVWPGELPFKQGDTFPTEDIKTRASISKTNKMLYNDDTQQILLNMLQVVPETDAFYGWRIREIVMNLPTFKNIANSWVGLCAGKFPLIDVVGDNDNDSFDMSTIVNSSNISEILQSEVRSRFLDVISAYRVDTDKNGKPFICTIEAKNLICYVSEDMPSKIEVNVVFSVYRRNGKEFIDFVEYHDDGKIVKTTFKYAGGTVGEFVERNEGVAFGGKFKASPIVVFKHNAVGNEVYGSDTYRYLVPSVLALDRALQNVMRLSERCREQIRKVPDTAIQRNEVDGSSVFFNKGTISYPAGTGNSPDIEYIVPEIRMEEAIKALEAAIRQVSMDSGLGVAFFDASSLGSRLSGDSLRSLLYPVRIEANRIVGEMMRPLKELIVKLGYNYGVDIEYSHLSVEFYVDMNDDPAKDVDAVMSRLNSDNPSISIEDAIMKLDRVPLKVARERANSIRKEAADMRGMLGGVAGLNAESDSIDSDESGSDGVALTSKNENLKPSSGLGKNGVSRIGNGNGNINLNDGKLWENEVYPFPMDVPPNINQEGR